MLQRGKLKILLTAPSEVALSDFWRHSKWIRECCVSSLATTTPHEQKHSTQQGGKRAGSAQKRISHGSIQHLEGLWPWPCFWSTWDSPWLFQMWKASLWSQCMALHISPLQGNISRTQQGLDQLLPLSVESCLSKCLALLAQGNTEFFCFRFKKPTSFNSFNLDSCTNSKEALERLHDYTEKGKMLKERLLTKSWIKKTSPGCPGCWERLPHTVSSFMLGSNTSWAWHQMQILVWGQSTNIQIHSWNVSQKYCFSKPCFSSSWCPCSAFWWAVSPSRVSHSECTAPRHWALTQELTGRELLMPGWWKL